VKGGQRWQGRTRSSQNNTAPPLTAPPCSIPPVFHEQGSRAPQGAPTPHCRGTSTLRDSSFL
jgi:hypothetical protein